MENIAMGRVAVVAKFTNLQDSLLAQRGLLKDENVRNVEVADALVDTGAVQISMPKRMIEKLGLALVRSRNARTAAGTVILRIYEPATVSIQGRECAVEVAELPDDCPVLIGQIPLELLDFVVDRRNRKLIGNPAHDGEHLIEMF